MDLNELIAGFSTTPFLFVGSGFSRRYYNLPDWSTLLRIFAQRLSDDGFIYNSYLSRARTEQKNQSFELPRTAELIMKDFDERWFADPSFRRLDAVHLKYVEQQQSPFKVEIAQYIEENSRAVPEMQNELELLKRVSSKSIAGIITTNYDCLLESETDEYRTYVGQEELVFSPIQGWAEIYKIHGSITNPESIVITESDYISFEENCPYLASKLMTIFMEYPIIFMGYSLSDPNVRMILESLVKCLSPQNLNKLQNRFVYVEWEKDRDDVLISDAAIAIGDKTIRMTRIVTDNFSAVFRSLEGKRATLPVKVFRLFKQEFYTYALTNQPTATLRVAGIDDQRVQNDELVLAIGKASSFGLRGLRGLTAEEWYCHIVLHDIVEFTADDILDIAYPALSLSNGKLPLNMLLHEAKKSHDNIDNEKIVHNFRDALNSTIIKSRERKKIPHRSVNGILSDNEHDLRKAMDCIAHLQENEIDIGELEAFLAERFKTKDYYKSISGNEKSALNRLVRIFDWMKYGK